MKYSQSSKNKFRRKFARLASYITLFLVLLIIVLSGYIVFIERGAFRIQSVEVTGTKSFVSQVDVAELVKSRAFGQNILIFNSGALETSLLESFQGAKEIFVRKSFPSTLKISGNFIFRPNRRWILFGRKPSFSLLWTFAGFGRRKDKRVQHECAFRLRFPFYSGL